MLTEHKQTLALCLSNITASLQWVSKEHYATKSGSSLVFILQLCYSTLLLKVLACRNFLTTIWVLLTIGRGTEFCTQCCMKIGERIVQENCNERAEDEWRKHKEAKVQGEIHVCLMLHFLLSIDNEEGEQHEPEEETISKCWILSFHTRSWVTTSSVHLLLASLALFLSPSLFTLCFFLFLSRSISCLHMHPNICNILLSICRACGMSCVFVCVSVSFVLPHDCVVIFITMWVHWRSLLCAYCCVNVALLICLVYYFLYVCVLCHIHSEHLFYVNNRGVY